jgi:hypothetical protein
VTADEIELVSSDIGEVSPGAEGRLDPQCRGRRFRASARVGPLGVRRVEDPRLEIASL